MAASVKPSEEEVPSVDRLKIKVTLSCRDSSVPERRLVLSRSLPVVPVGRSSKVFTKGFVPAADNAWFDNPVMSRQHAEILAKFDEKGFTGIYLKDVSSFHGTFYTPNDGLNKERRIAPNEMAKLTNGDIIKFGTEILRTNRNYPPCYVDFLMEEATQKMDKPSHRTFTVPDDIDEEEDGDCENEDDLAVMAIDEPTVATIKYLKPSLAASQSKPSPIDLTTDGDDLQAHITKSPASCTTNCNMDSEVIDLTSEPTHESDAELYTASSNACPPSNGGSDHQVPASASSDDHPGLGSNHTGDEADETDAPSLPRDFSLKQDFSLNMKAESLRSDILSDDWYSEDGEDEANWDSDSDSLLYPERTDGTSELDEMDGLSLNLDESSEPENEYEASDSFEDGFASDAEADLCFNDSDGDSSSNDEHDEMEDIATEPSNNDTRIAPLLTFLHGAPHYATTGTSIPAVRVPGFHTQIGPPPLRSSLNIHNPSNHREPSPSDAALFKCHPFFDNVPNDIRAHELGVKTGKFEFFAAREENRAAVNHHHQTIPISAIRETLPVAQPDGVSDGGDDDADDDHVTVVSEVSCNSSPSVSCGPDTTTIVLGPVDRLHRSDSEMPDASSIKLGDSDVNQSSAWTNSGDQFINNPPQDPQSSQPPPADFDMTSAYKFQQSKLATAAQTISTNRCLHIQDLLAQEPKEGQSVDQPTVEVPPFETVPDLPISCIPTPSKRTYDEAFNQPEDGAIDNNANDDVAICSVENSNKSDEMESSSDDLHIPATGNALAVQASPNVGQQDIVAQDSISAGRYEVSRPTKKIRVAQAIACVALGGAATFSYLVNTAPVF